MERNSFNTTIDSLKEKNLVIKESNFQSTEDSLNKIYKQKA